MQIIKYFGLFLGFLLVALAGAAAIGVVGVALIFVLSRGVDLGLAGIGIVAMLAGVSMLGGFVVSVVIFRKYFADLRADMTDYRHLWIPHLVLGFLLWFVVGSLVGFIVLLLAYGAFAWITIAAIITLLGRYVFFMKGSFLGALLLPPLVFYLPSVWGAQITFDSWSLALAVLFLLGFAGYYIPWQKAGALLKLSHGS